MTLLAVERIKLFSTRAPYWTLASILAAAVLFAVLMGAMTFDGTHEVASPETSQIGMQIGLMIFMVLAVLSMTTEYRFGTMRTTFLAAPSRARVLLSKSAVIIVLGAVVAAVGGLVAFYLTKALASNPIAPMELSTGAQWRAVLGNVAIYPIAGLIALAIGTLIRQSAGAISLVLVWSMLVEGLVALIPNIGPRISPWLPFSAGGRFTTDPASMGGVGGPGADEMVARFSDVVTPTPWQGLGVFAGTALVLWVLALVALQRRDA